MTTIAEITPDSPLLDAVKQLWRENSQTLGFFTSGAFDERAAKGQILGAIRDGFLVGYVLFYVNRRDRSIRVTHLCVSSCYRGTGVARDLIVRLSQSKQAYRGLGLHCRRDFEIWRMWPRLGFSAIREKTGRGADLATLTYFWLDHKHPDLFSIEADESRLSIVLDANVFYDLHDHQRGEEAQESHGLTADWLAPMLRLFVTPELSNEIQKNPDSALRERQSKALQDFDLLKADHQEFLDAHSRVISACGQGASEQSKADRRQLAWAIAADADVFVTRDRDLRSYSDTVFRQIGISIERPADVISKFDELCNEKDYRRDQLVGSSVSCVRCRATDAMTVADRFVAHGEKKAGFLRTLNHAFAHPRDFDVRLASIDGQMLCVHIAETRESTVNIPILRLSPKEKGTRLGTTLLRTVLGNTIQTLVSKGASCIRMTDDALSEQVQNALRDQGFLRTRQGWIKFCVRGFIHVTEIDSHLRHIAGAAGVDDPILPSGTWFHDVGTVLELERLIWPGKVSGANVPCFIVPIEARFAEDLFDGRLTQNRLWNASDLVLNPDSVYYRSVKPDGVLEQGRILWYVSHDGAIQGSKKMRACSQLTRVQVGEIADLFRKYRRFGVFDRPQVEEIAKDGRVMAIEFTNTELLSKPVSYSKARQLIQSTIDKEYFFQSPVRINEQLFIALYELGIGGMV